MSESTPRILDPASEPDLRQRLLIAAQIACKAGLLSVAETCREAAGVERTSNLEHERCRLEAALVALDELTAEALDAASDEELQAVAALLHQWNELAELLLERRRATS